MAIIVHNDLTGMEPHRQGMDRVNALESVGTIMGRIVALKFGFNTSSEVHSQEQRSSLRTSNNSMMALMMMVM